MPTIFDVAQLAGVSIKTVSRVMNKEPHVRDELRERVENAATKLCYQPSQAARRLAGRRSFLIAHIYTESESPYFWGIQTGAIRRCRDLGYHLVVEALDAHLKDAHATVDRIIAALSPDGIILTPPLSDSLDMLRAIGARGVRAVQVGSLEHRDGLHVFIQERAAARAVAEHLLDLGHRRIGMVRGHPRHRGAAARLDGFRDALAARGVAEADELIVQGYFDVQSGIEAGRAMLALAERPTAIFAANDQMALGVMIAARDCGLQVPADLSVAGFDDTPMSRLIWPPLTTVYQPVHEIGASAVDLLIRRKDAEASIEMPFEVRVRASTGAVPAA